MFFFLRIIPLFFILCSCGSHNLEDYKEEGEGITRSLIQELKKIRTREKLLASTHKLKALFNRLADTMISAEIYRRDHPDLEIAEANHELSDQLRGELNRIYEMDGGRQIIEKCEEKALHRLHLFIKDSK